MKHIMLVLALVLSTPCLSETEFGASHNGLIHADTTADHTEVHRRLLNPNSKSVSSIEVYLSKPEQ